MKCPYCKTDIAGKGSVIFKDENYCDELCLIKSQTLETFINRLNQWRVLTQLKRPLTAWQTYQVRKLEKRIIAYQSEVI